VLLENTVWSTWVVFLALVVYVIQIKKLKGWEKLVFVIIALNFTADFLACFSPHLFEKEYSGIIYNILAPVQRILTLMLYSSNTNVKEEQYLNYGGIVALILVSLGGHFYYQDFNEFHRLPYVILGLIVAILSYIHLRNMILEKTAASIVIAAFSLANFIYLTFMISSVSAVELAYNIDHEFGKLIYFLGNEIGYALWSIILIIGILWKKQKI
jgi:hypothetical protein